MKLTRYIYILLSIAGIVALGSCTDDYLRAPGESEDFVKGEPTIVTLNLQVTENSKMSRGEMPTDADNEINSLWLGFFDTETGMLMHKRLLGTRVSELGKNDHYEGTITLDGEKGSDNACITSGSYYIAAVANPMLHNGVLYNGDKKISTPVELDELLMNSVTTFDDYLGIAYMRGDGTVGSIGTPTGNLLMQGVFLPYPYDDNEYDADANCNFSDDNSKASDFFAKYTKYKVDIKATTDTKGNLEPTKLGGTIHFRRLVSQNKFTIKFDDKYIESFSIEQIRVFNVPTVAWLAERPDNNADGVTNAGDIIDIIGNKASTVAYTAPSKVNYVESPRAFSNSIKTLDDNTVEYDWWQIENRRYGNDECKSYNDREKEYKEYKTIDGKEVSDRNTGVYTSLSKSDKNVEADNNATYVEIRARVKLTKDGIKQPIDFTSNGVTVTNMQDDPLTSGATITEADVVYTIHLGYCEREPKGTSYVVKANDFNCRRNTKYNYTVNVNNVTNIFVEAKIDGYEKNPGAEGTLSFVSDNLYEADAHYCAYNIYLTDEERSDLNWQIRYYKSMSEYRDVCLEVPNELARPDGTTVPYTDVEAKYWQWVVLRPTSDANTIADYVPVGSTDKHKPFYLNTVQDLNTYPGYHGYNGKDNPNIGSWYTLFINEYVYGSTADGADPDDPDTADPVNAGRMTDNWRDYVNLPERSVWIKVKEYRSTDHESVVINSKYAVRQKSIQTFYNNDNGKSVFGAENTNETDYNKYEDMKYLQYLHQSKPYGGVGSDKSYPRMMMYNYVATPYIGTNAQDNIVDWLKYTKRTFWKDMPELGVPGLFTYEDDGYISSYGKVDGYDDYVPVIDNPEMGYACLNRNRDLNGNGKIDLNEIRWVLPSNELYTLMFFSAAGLKYPLFDIKATDVNGGEGQGIANRKFHYATIDGDMFWSEEGCSIGNMGASGYPTQIRCVRFLNNDTHSRSVNSPIAETFKPSVEYVDDQQRAFITCDLVPEALRDVRLSVTPPHRMSDDICKPYRKFEYEYDFEHNYKAIPHIVKYTNATSVTQEYSTYYGWLNYLKLYPVTLGSTVYTALEQRHNPCSDKNVNGQLGWRPANIKELAALKEADKLPDNSGSVTLCFGKDDRILVYHDGQIRAMNTNYGDIQFQIICVRDVD